jgi:hypothetical protein
MTAFAAWDGDQYIVRGEYTVDQARRISAVLRDAGMDHEADMWDAAIIIVVAATQEKAEIDADRDRALQRKSPPDVIVLDIPVRKFMPTLEVSKDGGATWEEP